MKPDVILHAIIFRYLLLLEDLGFFLYRRDIFFCLVVNEKIFLFDQKSC